MLLLFGEGQGKVIHFDLEWALLGTWRLQCWRMLPSLTYLKLLQVFMTVKDKLERRMEFL